MYDRVDVEIDYKKIGITYNPEFKPYLQAYILNKSREIKESKKRPAVIICPGGSYFFTSDREAEPIAVRFLGQGIHAFVLRYSTNPARYPCALVELAQSVIMLKENAVEWGIDPSRIVICGFSAGGHLCAMMGTVWNGKLLEEYFGTKDKRWKPCGMILGYPLITAVDYKDKSLYMNLLGKKFSQEQLRELSAELLVSEETLPAYIWHTAQDEVVPVNNSLMFANALDRYHVPFELHIYEKGVHAQALCDHTTEEYPEQLSRDNGNWMEMAVNWIFRIGGKDSGTDKK